jgi:cell division septum initiation protein DivIVA
MLANKEKGTMTNEEMEDKLKWVADSHVVQAELLDRLDRKLGQLAEESADHHRRLDQLLSGTDHLLSASNHLLSASNHLVEVSEAQTQQLRELRETAQNHERRLVGVEDRTALMLSALDRLFQRMDAFIQGLQKGDGHSPEAR